MATMSMNTQADAENVDITVKSQTATGKGTHTRFFETEDAAEKALVDITERENQQKVAEEEAKETAEEKTADDQEEVTEVRRAAAHDAKLRCLPVFLPDVVNPARGCNHLCLSSPMLPSSVQSTVRICIFPIEMPSDFFPEQVEGEIADENEVQEEEAKAEQEEVDPKMAYRQGSHFYPESKAR